MTEKIEEQKKHERKPAHEVFVEMIRELVKIMETETSSFHLQQAQIKLWAILEAIDRAIIPKKDLTVFAGQLQEIANSFRSYGTGKTIEASIARLLK